MDQLTVEHAQEALCRQHGVDFVCTPYDKSLINEDFIRRNWEMKMQATGGQTQRILANNPVLASELATRKLGAISISTLVVWGGDDLAEPLADGHD